MIVLGFHGGAKRAEEVDIWSSVRHDSSAVLMRDGEVLAAAEEERFNRLKHTNCFPRHAIEFCLGHLASGWDEVDLVVTSADAQGLASFVQAEALRDMKSPVPKDAISFVASLFQREFGMDLHSKIRCINHHAAHVWSAYAFSGFQEALVLSIDGAGDKRSGRVCIADDYKLIQLRDYSVAQSLGHFYDQVIRLIGFSYFDEYKAMGLAPYGDPNVFKALFEKGYSLLEDGNYSIDSDLHWTSHFAEAGLLTTARRKGDPFLQTHMDIAAALQASVEVIVLHVLKHYRALTGIRSLCLAGGVAHNCSLNGKILKSGLFDRMFVQPAAHDGGTPLGACCAAMVEKCPSIRMKPMQHVFLGSESDEEATLDALKLWANFLDVEAVKDPIAHTAALLAGGAVVGRVHGRAEFGPRALGNRSLLADPRPASHKDLINKMVKKREQFRPFAPAVLKESAGEFFEVSDCDADLSYMTYTVNVQPRWRSQLGAVTHVDGTARVQTVSREFNPTFWNLLTEFGRLTGVSILLNTSFNNNAEPIVESVHDAIVCFLTTGVNHLLVGPYLLSKKSPGIPYELFVTLMPEIPDCRKVSMQRLASGVRYLVESTKGSLDSRPTAIVSFDTYSLLTRADGNYTVSQLLDACRTERSEDRVKVVEELADLWSTRMICLRPCLTHN
jgi:carbamoyltransferase